MLHHLCLKYYHMYYVHIIFISILYVFCIKKHEIFFSCNLNTKWLLSIAFQVRDATLVIIHPLTQVSQNPHIVGSIQRNSPDKSAHLLRSHEIRLENTCVENLSGCVVMVEMEVNFYLNGPEYVPSSKPWKKLTMSCWPFHERGSPLT